MGTENKQKGLRFIKKNLLLLISVMLLTLLFSTSAMAVSALQIQVNGKLVEFDVAPYILNEEPMIPIRHLAETIGARVEWDAKARTAWIHQDMMHMEIPIDKTEFYIHRDADFSGIPQIVKLKGPIKIINGRTFLPALTLTEGLGLTASWDQAAKTLAVKNVGNAPEGKARWVTMDSTTVKSMELYSIDQEKLRACSEAELSAVMESFNQATIDQNFYIQMIAGRVLKVSLNDGREISFTSYGSKTNVVASFQLGAEATTYHLVAPAIAELLLQVN